MLEWGGSSGCNYVRVGWEKILVQWTLLSSVDEHPISWVVSSDLLLERPPFDPLALRLLDFPTSFDDSLFGAEKLPPPRGKLTRYFEKI